MKLTDTRYFIVWKGPVTYYAYIQHFKSKMEVVARYPGEKTLLTRGKHGSLRRLLDRLSRNMEVSQRIEDPEEGVELVEAITYEAYRAARKEYYDRRSELRKQRKQRARARREAKALTGGHS